MSVRQEKALANPSRAPSAALHLLVAILFCIAASLVSLMRAVILTGTGVEAEWPERMEIDRSDYIRISLRKIEDTFVPTIEVTGHTAVTATIAPVGGTPETPIESAYGPEYKAYVTARLEGTAFEITSPGAEYQSLDQDRITWDWNILPLKPGRQTINACVIVQWRSIGGKSEPIDRTIWRAPLTIVVGQPWIKRDQLVQLVLGSGILGSVLSVPWLYQKARERGERQRKVPYPVSLRRQLAEARQNLRLIQERKSEYVMETDIPLQLVKREQKLLERIEELEQRIAELE